MPSPAVCFVCAATGPLTGDGGLPGGAHLAGLPVCSEACRAESVRFAGRFLANRQTALGGHAVAALGLVAGTLFLYTERDLGRLLVAFSFFGLGTTRLAYPDVVPLALARRFGSRRVVETFQWLGIALCGGTLVAAALVLLF